MRTTAVHTIRGTCSSPVTIHDYPIRVTLNFDGQLDFVPCSQNLDEDTGGVAALQATRNGSQTTFKAFAWW